MAKNSVTVSVAVEDLKKLRIRLSYNLNTALENLKWDRMKLAEEYGHHMQSKEYTKGRISQLMKVNKGEEENSEKMFKWMNEQIKEQNGQKY